MSSSQDPVALDNDPHGTQYLRSLYQSMFEEATSEAQRVTARTVRSIVFDVESLAEEAEEAKRHRAFLLETIDSIIDLIDEDSLLAKIPHVYGVLSRARLAIVLGKNSQL